MSHFFIESHQIAGELLTIVGEDVNHMKNVLRMRSGEAFTAADENGMLAECCGNTDIFIYPGYRFKVLDCLITNFHLPESTLVMLVSALAGRENVLGAYEEAVKERYRFFSFGDAMMIVDNLQD